MLSISIIPHGCSGVPSKSFAWGGGLKVPGLSRPILKKLGFLVFFKKKPKEPEKLGF